MIHSRTCALLLACAAAIAHAQQAAGAPVNGGPAPGFVEQSWTTRDGLPVNSISMIVQSQSGYIWLATFDGLVRFDGVRFTTFNTSNSDGLPSNRIVQIYETRDSALWLTTELGQLVRLKSGKFTTIGHERGLDARVLTLREDRAGALWVGTSSGLGKFDGNRFVGVDASTQPVRAIAEAFDGTVWFAGGPEGLYQVKNGRAAAVAGTRELASADVRFLWPDSSGAMWIANGMRTWRHADTLQPTDAGTAANVDVVHKPGGDPGLWVWSASGMYRIDESGKKTKLEAPHLTPRSWFASKSRDGTSWYLAGGEIYVGGRRAYRTPAGTGNTLSITAILVDREGSLWFGTTSGGLHQLKPAVFTTLTRHPGERENNLYSVTAASGGGIWAGTWGPGELTRVFQDGRVTVFGPGKSIPVTVVALHEDRRGMLWLGAVPCRLPLVRCEPVPGAPDGVHAIHEEADGTMWFGTQDGLFRLHDGQWKRFTERDGAPGGYVRAFLRTADGALWMATSSNGIARFRDGIFRSVTTADGLPSDLVRSLYQDDAGWLWVGTEGMGIARLDPREWSAPGIRGAIVGIRSKDGLFDDVVHVILEDANKRLWMSSNRGIFWVARGDLDAFANKRVARVRSTAYTERHGLRNREANGGSQPAGTRSTDGRLWFATQDGVAVVDPSTIGGNAAAPSVVVERIVAGGIPVDAGSGAIAIAPDRRDLSIDYTALSFLAPENVRFRYRLDPYDKDWVDADTRRSATYTRVPPGEYTFRVIANNGTNAWSDNAGALRFRVTPRFFETRAFAVLVFIALALLMWLAVRWRIRRLQSLAVELQRRVDDRTRELRGREALLATQNTRLEEQAGQLLELDRAKSRFFVNVSHELRTPLTLTIGPLEDARAELTKTGDHDVIPRVDMALRNAKRLLGLVNQVLDVAKVEAGRMKLRAQPADLSRFVRGVAAEFAEAARRKNLTLEVRAPLTDIVAWFDPDALEKVLANLLSNALKFTAAGHITLTVEEDLAVNVARVRVSDSGPGIPREHLAHVFERFYQVDESNTRSQPGTGIGLSLARELAELHGGTLDVESSEGAGATFVLTLKLGRAHLRGDQIGADVGENRIAASVTRRPLADLGFDTLVLSPDESELAGDDGAPESRDDITTLLVVDDNADLRSYLRTRFDSRYRVIEAADGAAGIVRARASIPDLVISDVMMPGTDGHALCAALRASPETDFIPIILLTAQAEQEQRIAGLDRGADDYIVKPFDMRELEARVDNLISSRRRLRERFSGRPAPLKAMDDTVSADDKAYLDRLSAAVQAGLTDPDFGVNELAAALFQDRSQLFRRTRALLNETPSDLLRRSRLERAAELLGDRAGTIAEVAYGVGFNSVSHFCRAFRQAYGATPSAYRQSGSGANG